jgi:hypothetical protein
MMDKTRNKSEDLHFAHKVGVEGTGLVNYVENSSGFRSGDPCPLCQIGHLDYNGLLNLECDECKFTVGGCFT